MRGDPNPFFVDEQTTGPRSQALPPTLAQRTSHSAGVGTRVRPVRPIRFTPSRTDPVQRPPIQPPPSADRQPSLVARLAAWIAIALGWTIFVAWWGIVLQRETARSLEIAFGLLAATLFLCVIAMVAWTTYNIRLARRVQRRQGNLDVPIHWERDTLGRRLELPVGEAASMAPEVRVVLRNGAKAYLVVDSEEL